MAATAQTIHETLAQYNVEVEVGETKPGPTVTMYGLVPGWVRKYKQVRVTDRDGRPKLDELGKPMMSKVETKTRVKVDSIMSREKDLALALKTPSIRIETPVMGKSLVGIEVPNPRPTLVTLRNVMQSEEFQNLRKTAKLPVAIGKGSGGETVVIDLAKMPHLLVAGSTGSGKSVFINTIISCLIIEKDPTEVRLLLVDPKRVEMTPYNGIPHLMTPVVVETDQVVALLRGLIREMMDRYRRMEEIGVRNIDSYNRKSYDKMPYLVVAVDELADLMMTASVDVEQALCRLDGHPPRHRHATSVGRRSDGPDQGELPEPRELRADLPDRFAHDSRRIRRGQAPGEGRHAVPEHRRFEARACPGRVHIRPGDRGPGAVLEDDGAGPNSRRAPPLRRRPRCRFRR